jgi:hypothetical protein
MFIFSSSSWLIGSIAEVAKHEIKRMMSKNEIWRRWMYNGETWETHEKPESRTRI